MNCQRKRDVSSSLGARNAIGLLIVALLLSLGAPWFGTSSASASSHHQSQSRQAASSTPQLIFAGVDSIPFRLYALHGDTGAVAWSYASSRAFYHTNAVNGRLFLSGNGTLISLNAQNGQVNWSIQGFPFSTPVTNEDASGLIYIGGYGIYAFSASTGQLVWFSNPHPAGSSAFFQTDLVIANGTIYAGASDGMYALDKLTGKKLWGNTSLSEVTTTAYAVGLVYVVHATPDPNNDGDLRPSNILYAFNASNGTLAWSFRASERIPTSIRAVNGLVYFTTADSYVNAIKESAPSLAWRTFLPTGASALNAVTGGNVYLSGDGLYSLAWNTGSILWHYTDSSIASSSASRPTIAGLVYVGYGNGYVYAFDPTSPRSVWRAFFTYVADDAITVWW